MRIRRKKTETVVPAAELLNLKADMAIFSLPGAEQTVEHAKESFKDVAKKIGSMYSNCSPEADEATQQIILSVIGFVAAKSFATGFELGQAEISK